jgi:hypothetical protein
MFGPSRELVIFIGRMIQQQMPQPIFRLEVSVPVPESVVARRDFWQCRHRRTVGGSPTMKHPCKNGQNAGSVGVQEGGLKRVAPKHGRQSGTTTDLAVMYCAGKPINTEFWAKLDDA